MPALEQYTQYTVDVMPTGGLGVGVAIKRSRVRLHVGERLGNYSGQVVHTRVPSSPSSIFWHRLKAKFHCAVLVADRSDDGRRPAASWNLANHLARYSSELARAIKSATGLRQASDLSATRIA